MTRTEAARLAAAVNLLRPDWPTRSLETFIAEHLAGRPLRDATVALVWVATDADTKTPKRALEPGPWWQAAMTRDVPTVRNDCQQHPLAAIRTDPRTDPRTGQQACAGCHADRVAAAEPLPLRRNGEPPAREVRAQLVAAFTTSDRATASEATSTEVTS